VQKEIRQGRWPVGAVLPTEVELSQTFGVARSTVREAIRTLQAQGYVERRRRAGTFVLTNMPGVIGRSFVGLVVAHLYDVRLSRTLHGLQAELDRAGLRLEVRSTEDVADAEGQAVASLRAEGASGVFVEPAPGWPARELYRRYMDEGYPIVFLDRGDPELAVPTVSTDNRGGGLTLARHLLACGHRRIGFVLPRSYPTTSVAERVAGYQSALEEGGLDPDPGLVVQPEGPLLDPIEDALHRAVDRLLALPRSQRPSALMCSNDELASWVIAILKQTGLQVPTDISVTGYDDLEYAARLDPPLTTVRQPLEELGRTAARTMASMLAADNNQAASTVLPVHLAVRRSSGRASASGQAAV
jgi:DNA-binding LacI/PurR family transcriptional regulator